MCYVYVLICGDRKLYIGFSANLKKPLLAHKNGEVTSTRFRQPVSLFYYEGYVNQEDARAREVFLKSGAGHREFKRQHQHELARRGYRFL